MVRSALSAEASLSARSGSSPPPRTGFQAATERDGNCSFNRSARFGRVIVVIGRDAMDSDRPLLYRWAICVLAMCR